MLSHIHVMGICLYKTMAAKCPRKSSSCVVSMGIWFYWDSTGYFPDVNGAKKVAYRFINLKALCLPEMGFEKWNAEKFHMRFYQDIIHLDIYITYQDIKP